MFLRSLFLWVGLLTIHLAIQGQIVNIESSRLEQDSMGLQGEVNVFYNFTKNTKSISQLKSSAGLQERWKENVLLVFSDLNLVFSKQEDFVFQGFGHLR